MTKTEIITFFCDCKDKADEVGKFIIGEICELIGRLPEESLKKVVSITGFINNWKNGGSSLDDINKDLMIVHTELKKQVAEVRGQIKDEALCALHGKKKKRSIIVIVILSLIAGVVLTLGILSAFEIIPAVWCNVIGVVDCTLGLIFFIYEYCDDKDKEANINAGDLQTVRKYVKTTGDISNSGTNSVNITGKVKGNVSVQSADWEKLFK